MPLFLPKIENDKFLSATYNQNAFLNVESKE